MVEVSVPCGACGKAVRGGDEFCESCGARVGEELKRALRARLEASHSGFADHAKKLRNAQATIGGLAILFVLGGVIFFFITQGQVDDALAKIRGTSELRSALERRPWQVLGINLFLAAVMLGLWIWSKRALLPAIIAALGIYVAVVVASALYDPTTIAQGIVMKIVVVGALARGVQSTLAARELESAR